jgi:hypothetical protein
LGQPELLHTHRHLTGNPSTIDPQPGTTVQQANTRSANTFHRTYYYCCYLSIDYLLEEHPWGQHVLNRRTATFQYRHDPRRLAFKLGRNALRLVIGRLFSDGVSGVTKGPYRRGDHAG